MRYLGGGIGHLEQFPPPQNDGEDTTMNNDVAELEGDFVLSDSNNDNDSNSDDKNDGNNGDDDDNDCDEAGGNGGEEDDAEFSDEEMGNVY